MSALHRLLRSAPLLALAFLAGSASWPAPPPMPNVAQETTQTVSQETVVNLATGRVLVAVTKGAILVGTVEDAIEADTHPPIPVQIGSSRVGVILGAVDWIAPDSKQQIARLDQDLPRLRGREAPTAPHLGGRVSTAATDIEAVGDGLFSRLSELVRNLHGKIDLPSGEPIAVLIVADYLAGYGPEVWRIDYGIEQTEESQGYWTTRALQPSYVQCWPPEKGQPRALLEFAYPSATSGYAASAPASRLDSMIDLWRKKDPRLEKIVASDAHLRDAARGIFDADSSKVAPADAVQFLRAALDATSPREARETIAVLGEESGFKWILPPPAETVKPGLRPERPAGAPFLAAPPPVITDSQ